MPVTLKNLTSGTEQELMKDTIGVQYPFIIEPKTFAIIPILQDFKIIRVVASVVNTSTTQTSFSVETPTTTITVTIVAGQGISDIWEGEVIVSAGSSIAFKINANGTGSYLTMLVEGKYV